MLNGRKFKVSHRGVRILGKGCRQSSNIIPIENDNDDIDDIDDIVVDIEDDVNSNGTLINDDIVEIEHTIELNNNRIDDLQSGDYVTPEQNHEIIDLVTRTIELTDELIEIYQYYNKVRRMNDEIECRGHLNDILTEHLKLQKKNLNKS